MKINFRIIVIIVLALGLAAGGYFGYQKWHDAKENKSKSEQDAAKPLTKENGAAIFTDKDGKQVLVPAEQIEEYSKTHGSR